MIKHTLILAFLFCSLSFSQSSDKESASLRGLTQEEKEDEIIDYSNIKSVLKNDGLEKTSIKRVDTVRKIKIEKKKIKNDRFNYPDKEVFWEILSEMWLVKNAQLLRLDFPKPDYGIANAFKKLLEAYGYYNVNFRVLIVNTPVVSHFGLPAGKDRFIFILSLPFMRSLDLTKVDISLLLLEDFFRLKKGYFLKNLEFDHSLVGGNFKKGGFSKLLFTETLKKISEVVFKTGFTFEQQYLVTKDVDLLLKATPSLWSVYFKLYTKIDRFIKSDALFKNYLKIFPSPELQLKWLSPKKKVI